MFVKTFLREMDGFYIKLITLFSPLGYLLGEMAKQTPVFSNASFICSSFCGVCAGFYYIKKTFFDNNNQNKKNND